MAKLPVLYQPIEHERERVLAGMPLASFGQRFRAFAVDFLLLATFIFVLVAIFAPIAMRKGWIDPGQDYNLEVGFGNWYSLIFIVIYFSLSHYFGKGRTLGKRIFKLRVLSLKHEKIGFWHCVERALGYGASALELGFGFLQVLWNPDRRATHDRIAETIVVSEREKDLEPVQD